MGYQNTSHWTKTPLKPINHYGTQTQTEKLSIFTAMKGKLAMLTLGTPMQLVMINSVKYVQKNETPNLIPSVMEVAAGKRDKLLVFGNDFETIDGTGVRITFMFQI